MDYIIHHQEYSANAGKWISTWVPREKAHDFITHLQENGLNYLFKPSTVNVSVSTFYS